MLYLATCSAAGFGQHITMKLALIWLLGAALLLAVASFTAFQVSPWPSVLLMRRNSDHGGAALARALEKHVPAGVAATLNLRYDESDGDAFFDAFYPAGIGSTEQMLPTIVWVHGGAFVSGSKDYIANYLRILAAKGFTVIGVNYSLAPGKTYPTPIRQVNTALAFVVKNAARLHVDPSKLFLAGDSAGSQIAGQLANIVSGPVYANEVGIIPSIKRTQLRGVILFCGSYRTEGPFNDFRRITRWAYFGTKDFLRDPRLAQFSVPNHITAEFPAIFISAGNGDALLPDSLALAETAARRGVTVDTLFFPKTYAPALPHEYQFNLDNEAGQLALERTDSFVNSRLQ